MLTGCSRAVHNSFVFSDHLCDTLYLKRLDFDFCLRLGSESKALERFFGFDHGAGHPLLFLDDPKAPNY